MRIDGKRAITEQQSRLLYEACLFIQTYGRQPNFEELGKTMRLTTNAVCTLMKRLRETGCIKKSKENSNSWEIVKWFGEADGYRIPVAGEIWDDLPILYRDNESGLGNVWVPLPAEALTYGLREQLFILRLKNWRSSNLISKAECGGGLIFQRHRYFQRDRIVLAKLNGRINLFKILLSRTQVLFQEVCNQSSAPLVPHDHVEVLGSFLWPLDKSRMRLS